MAKLKTYHLNILESSTVTSDPAADSSFPVTRLYDRHIGRFYKAGSAADTTIHIDQGASNIQEVDTLIIPKDHNLSTLSCTLSYSDNDSDWTIVSSWTQADSSQIEKPFTAATHRYWRLVVSSPASAVQIAEVFLTKSYEWDRNPEELDRGVYPEFNVERKEDSGGRPRFIVYGSSKRRREYNLYKIHDTDKTQIEALNESWAGSKPFYLKDHDSNLMYGELISPLQFRLSGSYADTPFHFLEVLP